MPNPPAFILDCAALGEGIAQILLPPLFDAAACDEPHAFALLDTAAGCDAPQALALLPAAPDQSTADPVDICEFIAGLDG